MTNRSTSFSFSTFRLELSAPYGSSTTTGSGSRDFTGRRRRVWAGSARFAQATRSCRRAALLPLTHADRRARAHSRWSCPFPASSLLRCCQRCRRAQEGASSAVTLSTTRRWFRRVRGATQWARRHREWALAQVVRPAAPFVRFFDGAPSRTVAMPSEYSRANFAASPNGGLSD